MDEDAEDAAWQTVLKARAALAQAREAVAHSGDSADVPARADRQERAQTAYTDAYNHYLATWAESRAPKKEHWTMSAVPMMSPKAKEANHLYLAAMHLEEQAQCIENLVQNRTMPEEVDRVWAASVALLREESDRLDAAADVLWSEAEELLWSEAEELPSTEKTP